MVNTRRMESNCSTQGPRHRTRGNLRVLKVEVAEESASSSFNESDSEDSADKESSSNTPEKPKGPIKKKAALPSKELRSKFTFKERQYKSRADRNKRIAMNERRSSLAVYSPHKMHDDSDGNDTDEEIYSVRSRRSRHLIRMNRIQRRTALSLRPIRQKCYTDPHSPLHFNSDSEEGVRRSKRKRQVNMTWLADNQMHKVGYPNLHAGYSEEDSRDVGDTHRDKIEIVRRVTRRSNELKNSKFLYNFDDAEIPLRCPRRDTLRSKSEIRPRRESNYKENKKETSVNRSNGKLRSVKVDNDNKDKSNINENDEEFNESTNKVPMEENKEVKIKEQREEMHIPSSRKQEDQSSESGEEVIPLTRLRTIKTRNEDRQRKPNFPTRNEKVLDSSSESEEEEGKKYSLRARRPKPAPKTNYTTPNSMDFVQLKVHKRIL